MESHNMVQLVHSDLFASLISLFIGAFISYYKIQDALVYSIGNGRKLAEKAIRAVIVLFYTGMMLISAAEAINWFIQQLGFHITEYFLRFACLICFGISAVPLMLLVFIWEVYTLVKRINKGESE